MTVGMTTCLSARQTEVRYIKGAHFCSFLFIVLLLRELWLLQMWTNFLNLKSTNLHCWEYQCIYKLVQTVGKLWSCFLRGSWKGCVLLRASMYIQTSSNCRRAVELVFEGFVTTFHKKYLQLSGWVAPGTATGVHGWCPYPFIPIIRMGLSVPLQRARTRLSRHLHLDSLFSSKWISGSRDLWP